ncbi:imidazole glycerol phosphate synthase subunit HisH [Clostridium thermosuccinogenes]|uniref:Imidazole glycerol phosphate synthase subunit HisH n=1 Tax=Clostridium thermosuccinogenes TaxID=84032 RepID=A0A2K2FDL7_9CLOT|nr:imidazole glycerol phosphate synthase subunit HisH [Pseudoclostridium thermosuccinogenes]AUS98168.1 imidazole glycerol phosphate synthase subunit HisH [Pseudoclostridium thermosuccinogenes]PNT96854.1 imidazole glycerol phosphate synthase subunit HisH [Pseudoclostridium thermosuccinogenes]PNT98664.1 imidazole glycerol phosphate synthase subunit HisH [Pseudoclostridium thermosuccinogenes]
MIAIIDYGVGNLRSVEKAFEYIGCDTVITSDRKTILQADAVVLPGVGAFADAMENLGKADMIEVVKEVVSKNTPFLGICLGMQLLFDYSEEGGENVKGLGIFKGSIKQLPVDKGLKVPHIGWNLLKLKDNCPIFDGLPENPYVYFVHSYYLAADDRDIVKATADYGIEFDAAVGRGNVFAVQFHPEKSGEVGLSMLRNFVKVAGAKL